MMNVLHISPAAILIVFLTAAAVGAQSPDSDTYETAPTARLTVRPHAMAPGTRTPKAGVEELAGFPGYLLYVPAQCVGTKRAPLFVILHGGDLTADAKLDELRPLADKYGVIVLFPNASHTGAWEVVYRVSAINTATGERVTQVATGDLHLIDSALKLVLRRNAIDPNRIALLGFSDGGTAALVLGRSNQDVFSRVAALSALTPYDGPGPQNPHTQFVLSAGTEEGDRVTQTVRLARALRHQGHDVLVVLAQRGHKDQIEEEDFIWGQLLRSWVAPDRSIQPVASAADTDPVLTVEALRRLSAFWTRLRREPDSVLRAVRQAAYERPFRLTLAAEPPVVLMTGGVLPQDMAGLAAAYPSVAADLQAASLTAQQETAYLAAVLRVEFVQAARLAPGDEDSNLTWLARGMPVTPIAPSSALGRNLTFRATHDAAFQPLELTWRWWPAP